MVTLKWLYSGFVPLIDSADWHIGQYMVMVDGLHLKCINVVDLSNKMTRNKVAVYNIILYFNLV